MSLTVESHYEYGDLIARLQTALGEAGLTDKPLTWSDLAPLDQFHVGGHGATIRLVDNLGPREEDRVLDVGSGLGGPTRYLQATHGSDVSGIDLSTTFVEASKMLAIRTGQIDRLHYSQANALELPFDDDSFDIVMTQHVAMNIADRPALYKEMRRVLKSGGKLGIYDVVKGNDEPLTFPMPWARTPEISHLLTAEQTRSTILAAGFKELAFVDETEAAIEWFASIRGAGKPVEMRSPLGLQVVMGPEFAGMAANLSHALRDGRAQVVQAIFQTA